VLNNIADMWVSQGKYEEALAMAQQATQVDEGLGMGDTMDLEEPVETTAEALLELGRYTDALEPLRRCLAIEAAHHASPRWQSETLSDIGRAYVGAGQPETAFEYLERVVQAPDQADAQYLAEARFALARALRMLHKDAPRATALARAARDGLDAIPQSPALKRRLSEIEAWLASPQ
jgi:tetratricopeptide (TPR) repeat protein